MLVGVSTATFYPMVTEKALLLLAEQGIKNVEIFINSNLELQNPIREIISKTIREYSLNVLSVHPMAAHDSFFLFSNYERRLEQYLEMHKRCFDCMNEWNSEIFVFHGLRNESPKSDELYFERYSMLIELARRQGITVAQENVAYCKSGQLEFLKKMKQCFGEKAAFTLDLKQAVRAGGSPFEYLDALGESIIHVHASDSGVKGDCLPIGKGSFDFAAFFKKLDEKSSARSTILELYSDGFGEFDEILVSVDNLKRFTSKESEDYL